LSLDSMGNIDAYLSRARAREGYGDLAGALNDYVRAIAKGGPNSEACTNVFILFLVTSLKEDRTARKPWEGWSVFILFLVTIHVHVGSHGRFGAC